MLIIKKMSFFLHKTTVLLVLFCFTAQINTASSRNRNTTATGGKRTTLSSSTKKTSSSGSRKTGGSSRTQSSASRNKSVSRPSHSVSRTSSQSTKNPPKQTNIEPTQPTPISPETSTASNSQATSPKQASTILSTKKTLGLNDILIPSTTNLDVTQLSDLFVRTKEGLSLDQLAHAQASMATINAQMDEIKKTISEKKIIPPNLITLLKTSLDQLLSTNNVDMYAPPLQTVGAMILSGQTEQGNATEEINERNIDATNLFKKEQYPSLVIISKPGITQYQLDIASSHIPNILSEVTTLKNAILQNQPVPETLLSSLKTKLKNLLATNNVNMFVEPYKDTIVPQRLILTGQLSLTNYTILNATDVQALTPDQLSKIAVLSKENITNEKLSSLQLAVVNLSVIHSGSTQQQIDSVKTSMINLLNQGDIIIMAPPKTIPLVSKTDTLSILQSIPAAPPFNVPYIKLLLNTMGEGITYQQSLNPFKQESVGIIANLEVQQPYLNRVLGLNTQTDDNTVLSKVTPDVVNQLTQVKNWLIEGATNQSLIISIPQNAYNSAKLTPTTTPPSAIAPVVDQTKKAALIAQLMAIDLTAFNPPAIDPYNPTPLPVDKVPTAKLILNSNNAGIKVAARQGIVGNNEIANANTAVSNIVYEQQNLHQYYVNGKDDATIAANIGPVAWKFQTIINMIIDAVQKDYITVTFP